MSDLGLTFSITPDTPDLRWIASLSDGSTCFMDPHALEIEGYEDPLASWQRLNIYCEAKKIYLTGMRLQFRSHTVNLPSPCDGYYFSMAFYGGPGVEKHKWAVGYQIDYDTVHVDDYFVPELEIHHGLSRKYTISEFDYIAWKKFIQKPND